MAIIVNGVTLNGDFFDADFIDLYQAEMNELLRKGEELKGRKFATLSEAYRANIDAVEEFFDNVFGAGSAERVFAECRSNVKSHLAAVVELKDCQLAQNKELNDLTNRYSQRSAAQDRQAKAAAQANLRQFAGGKAGHKHKGGRN